MYLYRDYELVGWLPNVVGTLATLSWGDGWDKCLLATDDSIVVPLASWGQNVVVLDPDTVPCELKEMRVDTDQDKNHRKGSKGSKDPSHREHISPPIGTFIRSFAGYIIPLYGTGNEAQGGEKNECEREGHHDDDVPTYADEASDDPLGTPCTPLTLATKETYFHQAGRRTLPLVLYVVIVLVVLILAYVISRACRRSSAEGDRPEAT